MLLEGLAAKDIQKKIIRKIMKKIWFITGSSRGLGRALTQAALAAGHSVVATARHPEQLKDLVLRYGSDILPVQLDVTSPADAEKAVKSAIEAFGRIDVLVNNAGYGFSGAFEEMTAAEFAGQIDTNFWGVVHVTRAALPVLRRQGHGHIIQITSIGGRIGVPGLSGYNAAKFAVEGFSEALALEIKPMGLKLTIVEPGGFRTDWAGSSMSYAKSIAAYAPSVGVMRSIHESHAGHEPGDPRKGAAAILQIADEASPPLRLILGNDAMALGRRAYQQNLEELESWSSVSRSTDFDSLESSASEHKLAEVLAKAGM
jgi:NAD(P)-dependent dehydrogenase (short-subunit alcohol dehydrogenase family)